MKTKATQKTPAAKLADAIVADLSDRRGLSGEWDQIDDDVRGEIILAWSKLAEAAIAAAVAEEREACAALVADAGGDLCKEKHYGFGEGWPCCGFGLTTPLAAAIRTRGGK